jgi:RNA polymerase sigma-70 factor (ECF subfamily)
VTDASDPLQLTRQPILDRLAFDRLADSYRRELKLHCYRMMGSLHEADDLVQDTFLQAWRKRSEFDGRGSVRAWLHTIATNSCLNAIKARSRTRRVLQAPGRPPSHGAATGGPAPEVPWLEPYPDSELPAFVDHEPGPEARYEAREAVRLAFVAAIQALPPRQRAVLLLSDVLGSSAIEMAQLLGGSTASINSALQRARATLAARYPRGRPAGRLQPNPEEERLLERYVQAYHAASIDDLVSLLREDAIYQMPPWREWYLGREAIRGFLETIWARFSAFRAVAAGANAQPAVALYASIGQDSELRPHSLHLFEPSEGGIAEVTIYVPPLGPQLFATFGLPAALT